MELEVGPFDPALHILSRDHYEAVRREAQLLTLDPEAPSARLEELIDRLSRQFPRSPVDEVAERAYLAKEPSFAVRYALPDELVPAALAACVGGEELLGAVLVGRGHDLAAQDRGVERRARLDGELVDRQVVRAQLQGAHG